MVDLEARRRGGFRSVEGLRHIPLHLRTAQAAYVYLFQRGHALVHVPPELRTRSMCAWALSQGGPSVNRLIPFELRAEMAH